MSLRFICVEVRKNLHCANVFLQFDQSLTETEFLKIHVEHDAIRLREYSTETCASVRDHFAIEARTMSNLTVEECNASFRITIDEIPEDDSAKQPAPMALLQQVPRIEINEDISVHCKNCEGNLTENHSFQRILEFPSGSIDMGEFFCHHGPDFGQVLVPQSRDLFYGFQFIVLNSELVAAKTKEKETHIYCRRCLQYLGEAMFDGKAFKLWCDILRIKKSASEGMSEIFNTTQHSPTCQLLYKIIRESSLDHELLHQMQFSKVILEATFPNRQRSYLLLNILEKQLEVLRNAKPLAHGSINNNNVLQVKLEKFKCFKLLYRVMDDQPQTKGEASGDAPLLAFWKQDITIHLVKISPTLFRELLAELEENSLLLPELYRFTNDDFQLSYVFYNH